MLKLGVSRPTLLPLAMLMLAFAQQTASADPRASEFKLSNGMDVVVIPDHRAPVVTHMVWYKVGAADEPKGVSGIAHFLEHLMFKSTDKIAVGDFSKIVSKLGGQDNAFTGQDVTAYHQRIAKEQLGTLMEMEADRMTHLRLTNDEVATERQVIIEERRSRIENNPGARLDEQMNATLYLSHPYGVPVIGWEHEMAKLSREDALRFYKRYYAPNNAILVVAGDVTVDEVKRLAEATYGKVPANPEVDGRTRPQEPPHIAARRLTLKDARAGNASIINMSSTYGLVASAFGGCAYHASKAGILGLTKAAALEYAKQKIRVNAICPAFVATAMVEKFLDETHMTDQIKSFHPIGRLGTEEEIAQAVVFLASDASSFMTGTALSVDGGMTAA